MAHYKQGDMVLVDAAVFVASPMLAQGWFTCEVLEDSDKGQTYICRVGGGSPMYVRDTNIKPLTSGKKGKE
jgi:hypothetical protein